MRLRLDGIAGMESTRLPSGEYRLTISGMSSVGSGSSAAYTHSFQIATPVPFGPRQVIHRSDPRWDAVTADLDGDNDLDILCASGSHGTPPYGYVAWYENLDGLGNYGPEQVIPTDGEFISTVHAVDLDRDGDLDVLSVLNRTVGPLGSFESKIIWNENLDGAGTFGSPHVIATVPDSLHVQVGDVDGDGDPDVISGFTDDGPGKIAWYENTDGSGSFGPAREIATDPDGRVFSVSTADLDGDGDQDVLADILEISGYKIVWYENVDGMGNFGRRKVIDSDYSFEVHAADLDGDGDLDVLSASYSNNTIAWYENTNGQGDFGSYQEITGDLRSVYAFHTTDLDDDGDLDVLSGVQNEDRISRVIWHENIDGRGNFGPQRIIASNIERPVSVSAADLDNDGDPDVISASSVDNALAWYNNLDGVGTFGPQQEISPSLSDPRSVYAADLDGDGDLDAVCASVGDDKIIWYENAGHIGTFDAPKTITAAGDFDTGGLSVFVTDLDDDGDQDILAASSGFYPWADGKIAWYENLDGEGMFGPQHVITTSVEGPIDAYAADLDDDGDLDVLSASRGDNMIAWYENVDGAGNFSSQRVITTNALEAADVHAADLDGDGDLDVLSASTNNNTIAWYENLDGAGTFGPLLVITTNASSAVSVETADLDGDGDLDVISGDNGGVAWYENTDGKGQFGPRQVLPSTPGWRSRRVVAADLDDDDDLDIISAEVYYDSQNRLYSYRTIWHENVNGMGDFGVPLMIEDTQSSRSIFAGDLDGDRDLDLLSALSGSNSVAWYENLLPHAGDANRDGRFDTADFVQVFQAGEYEDGIDNNSTWEEGDWNGDGDFDTADFVLGFPNRTVRSEVRPQHEQDSPPWIGC